MAKRYKKYWYKVYLVTEYEPYALADDYERTYKLLYETHSLNKVMDYLYTHRHLETENSWLWYERLNRI